MTMSGIDANVWGERGIERKIRRKRKRERKKKRGNKKKESEGIRIS